MYGLIWLYKNLISNNFYMNLNIYYKFFFLKIIIISLTIKYLDFNKQVRLKKNLNVYKLITRKNLLLI